MTDVSNLIEALVTGAVIASGMAGPTDLQSTQALADMSGHYSEVQQDTNITASIEDAINDRGNETTFTSGKP